MPEDYQKLLEKYKQRIKAELGHEVKAAPQIVSREYQQFKEEIYPASYSLYEKACNFSEKVLKLKADPKKATVLEKNIDLCHLQITPSGVISKRIFRSTSLSRTFSSSNPTISRILVLLRAWNTTTESTLFMNSGRNVSLRDLRSLRRISS